MTDHPRTRQARVSAEILEDLKAAEAAMKAQGNRALKRIALINFVVFLMVCFADILSIIISKRAGWNTPTDLAFTALWNVPLTIIAFIQIPIVLSSQRTPWVRHLLVTCPPADLLFVSAGICAFGISFMRSSISALNLFSNDGIGLGISLLIFLTTWGLSIRYVRRVRRDALGTCDWCGYRIHDTNGMCCTECGTEFE